MMTLHLMSVKKERTTNVERMKSHLVQLFALKHCYDYYTFHITVQCKHNSCCIIFVFLVLNTTSVEETSVQQENNHTAFSISLLACKGPFCCRSIRLGNKFDYYLLLILQNHQNLKPDQSN